jgi:maleylacetoacetate isomerase
MQKRIHEALDTKSVVLFSYFRSTCSWRVRTILNLKQIPYQIVPVNLLKGEQRDPEYTKLNPNGAVPTLFVDGKFLGESMAIAEFLEERFKDAPLKLLPDDLFLRAKVRQICETVNAGLQPLQNLKVLLHVEGHLHGDKIEWAKKWNEEGLRTLDNILKESAGKHAVGDSITLADIFVFPQFTNAVNRFGIKPEDFPHVARVAEAVKENEAFVRALPQNQPDAA